MIHSNFDPKANIRIVPNFPVTGISFKDITPLLSDAYSYKQTFDTLVSYYQGKGITKVCGIDSRGFIFGGALAIAIGAGFVPIRKLGKLPYETYSVDYKLEYGTSSLSIHTDAISPEDIVLIHDDVLATGGTMAAAVALVKKSLPQTIYINFILELLPLSGRKNLTEHCADIFSLVTYDT